MSGAAVERESTYKCSVQVESTHGTLLCRKQIPSGLQHHPMTPHNAHNCLGTGIPECKAHHAQRLHHLVFPLHVGQRLLPSTVSLITRDLQAIHT